MTKGANGRNNKTTKRSRIGEVFPATFTYEFEDGTEAESDVLHRSGRSSRTKKTEWFKHLQTIKILTLKNYETWTT